MAHKLINTILTRTWLRISLAVGLMVVGLAPIGVPIVSDSSWRLARTGPEIAAVQPAQPFMYRTADSADGSTRVQRSDDGAATWHDVAAIPAPVQEIVAVAGNEEAIYARTPTSVWVSDDAGATWSQTASLPSRPAAMAVTAASAGTLYVGTESGGLLRSNNSGASWQTFANAAFPAAGAAPLGVTALAINPEDEGIVYAAVGFWLGTTHVRFNPLGLFASVDGGSHWSQMSVAALGSPPVEKIEPVAGQPLAVVAIDSAGEHRIESNLSEALAASLDDTDPGTRAAAARTIGLLGDKAALPVLLDHLQREGDVLAGEQIGWAIGRLGDRSAVQPLFEALSSGNEALQSRAAYALGILGAEEAVPLLAETLETGGAMAQRRAAEALAAVGTPEAIAALQTPLSSSEMTSARNAAMVGLEVAGERAVSGLTQALGDRDPVLRTNAAEMLGWLKAGQATPELSRALSDADAAVRVQAAWALGEIGTPEARQALANALRSETNAVVRQTSEAALARGDSLSRPGSFLGPGWATGLLGILATIPVGKWAFMTLATGVALLLLLAGSRQAQARAV
jgi:HEAT repeat protein